MTGAAPRRSSQGQPENGPAEILRDAMEQAAELRFAERLSKTMIARAFNKAVRAKLDRPSTTCIILLTPTHEFDELIEHALIANGFNKVIILSTPQRRGTTGESLASLLSTPGKTFAIVSPGTKLPNSVAAAADLTVRLPMPHARLLSQAIRAFTGQPVSSEIYKLNLRALTLDELAACVPKGISSAAALRKLKRAIDGKTRVSAEGLRPLPQLDTAHGYGAARDWALALREDIRDYRKGAIKWPDVDRGALFAGPPGTGKTLFAQVIASSCELPLILTSVGSWLGKGDAQLSNALSTVREAFSEAIERAPSLLFVDELDSLPSRSSNMQQNRDYWLPLINEFLMLLDSAGSDREGVVVVGATNRPEDIDPAILRPGRLERTIWIGPPSPAALAGILRFYLRDELPDLDLVSICESRPGATGAEAEEWARAARRSARRAGRAMVVDDLLAQVHLPDPRSKKELERVAIHEAGHAVVALVLGTVQLAFVTITPQGRFGGHTAFEQLDGSETLSVLEDHVVAMLAGRAAEQVLVSESPTAGAASDLAMSTNLLAAAHTSLGMRTSLVVRGTPDQTLTTIAMDPDLRQRVEGDLQRLMSSARSIVAEYAEAIREVAHRLVAERRLLAKDVAAIVVSVRD